jgi:hypothetical protein
MAAARAVNAGRGGEERDAMAEPDILRIENDGAEIKATNYFDTPGARAGKFFLSLNAGAFRLLVPITQYMALAEMRTARGAAVSRGNHDGTKGLTGDGVEVLFDDGTDSPFALHLGMASLHSIPPASESGRRVVLSVWTAGQGGGVTKALELPCTFRVADRLPDLRPWNEC